MAKEPPLTIVEYQQDTWTDAVAIINYVEYINSNIGHHTYGQLLSAQSWLEHQITMYID